MKRDWWPLAAVVMAACFCAAMAYGFRECAATKRSCIERGGSMIQNECVFIGGGR